METTSSNQSFGGNFSTMSEIERMGVLGELYLSQCDRKIERAKTFENDAYRRQVVRYELTLKVVGVLLFEDKNVQKAKIIRAKLNDNIIEIMDMIEEVEKESVYLQMYNRFMKSLEMIDELIIAAGNIIGKG